MLKRIWQWIVTFARRVLGWLNLAPSPSQAPPAPAKLHDRRPLSDAEYEHFFMQLLDGVHQGWTRVQIRRFFETLSDRASSEQWLAWLRRFGDTVVASPTAHNELGQRLIRLSEVWDGELAQVAGEIGTRAIGRDSVPPSPTPSANPPESQLDPVPDPWDDRPVESPSPEPATEPAMEEPPPPQEGTEEEPMEIRDAEMAAKFSDSDRKEIQQWFQQGVKHLDEKEYEAALAQFDRLLEVAPNDHRALINRGNALAHLDRKPEAIASYDRAIEVKPDSAATWNNRGDILYELGRWQEAIASWDKALEFRPDDIAIWYNKGLTLSKHLNQWEEAIGCWDKALELQPNDVEIWFNRGIGLGVLERWEEAIASWDKALQLKPDLRDAWINKGVALQKLGRYTEAIEANNRAIALGSSYTGSSGGDREIGG